MIAARRVLNLVEGERSLDVPVEIDAAFLDRDAWTCNYRIDWPSGRAEGHATAFDSVQAIYFAMQYVAAQLCLSAAHRNGTLYWDKPGDGYGFPLPFGSRDLAIGTDRKL